MAFVPIPPPNLGSAEITTQKFSRIRGVDFTTPICRADRSPDMQNMWRDWWGNGDTLVMMPGFRIVGDFETDGYEDNRVLGVHAFKAIIEPTTSDDETEEGEEPKEQEEAETETEDKPTAEREVVRKVIVHYNGKLLEWLNFEDCTHPDNWETPVAPECKILFEGMSLENKSQSVIFNNKMYILDGKNYLVYDGKTCVPVSESKDVFVPTTFIARTSQSGGTAFQQRNLLTSKFKNLARGDGSARVFSLSEKELGEIVEVKVNDNVVANYSFDLKAGTITFNTAPPAPLSPGVDNIEFTASKEIEGNLEKVTKNRVLTIFDNRIFTTGNPDAHNDVRWGQLNRPDYFGEINYVTNGNGASPIMNLIKVGTETLAAVKADTQQDGIVYYHTPVEMGNDVLAKTYPARTGVSGIGSISHFGANTLSDEPLFLTREGVSAIGQLSYGLERSIEHRSSYVDRRMRNERNPEDAVSAIWRGYYCVLFPSGNMYMADHRMRTPVEDSQNIEYEWFLATDIGVYEGQKEFDVVVDSGKTVEDSIEAGTIMGHDWGDGIRYYLTADYERWQGGIITDDELRAQEVQTVKEMRGGEFRKPVYMFEHDNQLYFTTENGKVCKFNADIVKHEDTSELRAYAFNNNGRKIDAYYTTPLYDYGQFNRLKRFMKRGNVLFAQSFRSSWVRASVRTNRSHWNEYPRLNAGYWDYSDWDYGDVTYNTFDQLSIVFRKLKEKRWQVAQIKIETAKINSAFGLHELTIRVRMGGFAKR